MTDDLTHLLTRIADALDRLAPKPVDATSLNTADAFQWHGTERVLLPVGSVSHVPLDRLRGIEAQKSLLLDNTRSFAQGHDANNAMLWGARGMGKSSLVKAVHARVNADAGTSVGERLTLIEIQRDDLATLPALLGILRTSTRRFIVFCDDLSFEYQDADYKSLKSVLDGGILGRPANVLFYATSNRRHLMPRDMMENERERSIHPDEAIEEKVSLSDRFGLWIGLHKAAQDVFFDMVDAHAAALGITLEGDTLHRLANAWAMGRGGRSGRVAQQFAIDLATRAITPVHSAAKQ